MTFGSEILVHRHGGVFAWACTLGGLGLCGLALLFLTPAWRAPLGAKFFGVFGVLFLVGGVVLLTTVFEFYEFGLVRRTLFGARELPYREIDVFTFQEVNRVAYGLAKMGATVDVEIKPKRGGVLRLHASRFHTLPALHDVRSRVAEAMATELEKTLQNGGEFNWAGAQLTANKVVVFYGSLSGTKTVELVISRDLLLQVSEGVLGIFKPGEGRSTIQLSTLAPNFFPGVALFRRLVAAT